MDRRIWANPKAAVVLEPPGFDALVRSMGFTEVPPKQEPEGYWQKLRALMNETMPMLKLITRSEMVSQCVNPENSTIAARTLSDNYVAGIISHKNPELRKLLKEQPILLDIKRQQLLIERKIKQLQNG